MHLLYVGQLWNGGTCGQRMRTLQRLGCEVTPFDVTPYAAMGSRVEQSILSRTKLGRGIVGLNRALEALARETAYDAVWVDKGVLVYPETLALLRKTARRQFAVHYTPDAQLMDNRSRHFLRSIPSFDLLITTKPFELNAYAAAGASDILLILQGYGRQFTPAAPQKEAAAGLRSEVCFVGHCQRHYAARIKSASAATSGLRVWGPRWPRYARWHAWARPIVQGEGLWGDSYPVALSSTKIALGLLSKYIPETTTTRSFEIPAAGTFMLAERNPDHAALFEEGREAEFFGSDEEMCDKIRFYLANDSARARIAAAGRERSVRSGYSDEHQLQRVLEHARKLMGGPAAHPR